MSLPHKKKLSFWDQLLTERPAQHDLLLKVTDDGSINVSQIAYLFASGYTSYTLSKILYLFAIADGKDRAIILDSIKTDYDALLLHVFLWLVSTYKTCNAEHMVPIVIEDEQSLTQDSQLFG